MCIQGCIKGAVAVQDGKTALFIASSKGHGTFVKLLIQLGADVHIAKEVWLSA